MKGSAGEEASRTETYRMYNNEVHLGLMHRGQPETRRKGKNKEREKKGKMIDEITESTKEDCVKGRMTVRTKSEVVTFGLTERLGEVMVAVIRVLES